MPENSRRVIFLILICAVMLAAVTLACGLFKPTATVPVTGPGIGQIGTIAAQTLTVLPPTACACTGEYPGPGTPVAGIPGPGTPFPPTLAPTAIKTPLTLPASGLRVVYEKEGVLWIWTENGQGGILTDAGDVQTVRLSDDGQVVAYTRQVDDNHIELWAINSDGTGEQRLVSAAEFTDMDPGALAVVASQVEWVPGTHTLAFNTRQVTQGPGLILYDDLRLVEVDTKTQSTLLAPGDGGQFYYSPDGQQIAIVKPDKISLVNADASNRRDQVLTYQPVLTYSDYKYYPGPVWAPDSRSLMVAIPPPDPLGAEKKPTEIWSLTISGAPATKTGSVLPSRLLAFDVAIAPDLAHVSFSRETGDPSTNLRELHLALPDGSGDTPYQTAPLLKWLAWAPDAAQFAFSTGEQNELQLGKIGAPAAPLPDGAENISDLRWVDAARFLYLKGIYVSEDWELHLSTPGGAGVMIDKMTGNPPSFDFAPKNR